MWLQGSIVPLVGVRLWTQHKLEEDIYSVEILMKLIFLWLSITTLIANIQAFINNCISLTSVTFMMSAAEQGGAQLPADVVPSLSGGRGAGREDHGGGGVDRSRGGRCGHGNQNNNNNNSNKQVHFTGRESQLNGFILDYTGKRNPDQYIHFKD